MDFLKEITRSAVDLARTIKADAILVITETGAVFDELIKHDPGIPVLAASANDETYDALVKKSMLSTLNIEFLDAPQVRKSNRTYALKLLTRGSMRSAQIEDALLVALSKGILDEGNNVVVVGSSLAAEGDSVYVYPVSKENLNLTLYESLREARIKQEVFEATLNIALEIGREGRGGRPIGTAFLIGDTDSVMKKSRQLILNPFEGHVIGERVVTNEEIKETIKEIAQMDGVFVVSEDGVIEAAGRYLMVDTSKIDVPRGLGTRHAAVAATTAATKAVGITVSQSGGIVRLFKAGEVFMTIEPQRRISLRTESLRAGPRSQNIKSNVVDRRRTCQGGTS